MAWTIPDKGEGDNDLQSILFQEYLEVLVDGINGLNCVVSGCAVTGGADMTPEVAKGAVLSNGTLFAVAASTVAIGAADATNPRIDLVVVTSAGALTVRAGTASASPKPPARTANDVVLAAVYVPAGDTSIETTKITDLRVVRSRNITLAKTTTAVAFNNTAAQQTYFSLTLPSGLATTGKVFRMRCGGTFLLNSGTPTLTLAILFGGVAVFQDATGTATADVDRGAWQVDMIMVSQANNDHAFNGICALSPVAAKTAPTAGAAGDISIATPLITPINASSVGDGDLADRVLALAWTMSTANASNEVVMEYAVLELL